jgi:XTP/dITP diphosphohydrolase
VEALKGAREARLASQNRNKLAELRAALPGWQIEPLAAERWPEETGGTYHENALRKARFGREIAGAGVWLLGEDSGIECDALGGEPGLHSARWAMRGDHADALLERLRGEVNRRARMVAELVALSPDAEEFRGRGVLEGTVAEERRGQSGFGYDPIFVPDGYEQTVAELGDAWKVEHSHRGKAAKALAAAIAERRGGAGAS